MTKKVKRLTWPWPADPFITLTIDQPATSGAVVALELDGLFAFIQGINWFGSVGFCLGLVLTLKQQKPENAQTLSLISCQQVVQLLHWYW